MIKVVLLGSGNVASYLFQAFSKSEKLKVIQVYNHSAVSLAGFREKVPVTIDLKEVLPADIYLIAVKDDAIVQVAEQLKNTDALVLHTSGAISMDILKPFTRRGVFYPLQTFSKDKEVKHKNIPFCLEVSQPKDLTLLKQLATEISGSSFEVSSEQRKKLHLAAVFVCNFVNHLYAIGAEICRENDLPFEILQPLIRETAEKVADSSPLEVQTGPAKRNDRSTIMAHLDLISSQENKEIYKIITQAIQSTHGKKL